jgi:ParB family chromosome partitioning protein
MNTNTITPYEGNAVFWVEINKVIPNPYQPRKEFDESKLRDLSESIRMYGVLQPLVVTRKEVFHEGGGMSVEYELISGERRLRASKLAGLQQVPVLIRNGEESARLKLELAIIENLQREDLNVVDRARSFDRLVKEFNLKHVDIAVKVGKSREYVSNTLRILLLSEEILKALEEGKISEGHTRPLLMLTDHPEEQEVLFKEIMVKKLSVREAEALSRKVATDRVRKREKYLDPSIMELEKSFTESLGTKVRIDKTKEGGTITIAFFSPEDLRALLHKIHTGDDLGKIQSKVEPATVQNVEFINSVITGKPEPVSSDNSILNKELREDAPLDDRSQAEKEKEDNEEIYSLKNFSL